MGGSDPIVRLANAVERIADALEVHLRDKREPIVVTLDGKLLSQQVMRYTLKQAARGATSLVGGSSETGTSKKSKAKE